MDKEFVKYEQALALKELGFDEKSLAYWFNETPLNPEGQCLVYYRKPYDNVGITNGIIREYGWAPLYQQAFRWFRDKHNLVFNFISYSIVKPGEYHWSITWNDEAKASGIVKTVSYTHLTLPTNREV